MANPIFKMNFSKGAEQVLEGATMTASGTIVKSLALLSLIVLSGAYNFGLLMRGSTDKAYILTFAGFLVSLISALIVIFVKPRCSNILSVMYAIGEGLLLGTFSYMFESYYPGIVLNAVLCTLTVMAMMFFLYKVQLIRCTDKFRSVVTTATASVALIYLIQIGASFFGRSIPQIFTASAFGIGFSVVVCLIAAMNFIVDFDFIEKGEQYMLPKLYEWVAALSLMFSLVWLYMEILRLLAKLNSRR